MQDLTVMVLVATVVVSLLGVGWFLRRVAGRVRGAYADAVESYERLQPALEQLERDLEVSRRELDRIGAGVEQLSARRAGHEQARRRSAT